MWRGILRTLACMDVDHNNYTYLGPCESLLSFLRCHVSSSHHNNSQWLYGTYSYAHNLACYHCPRP